MPAGFNYHANTFNPNCQNLQANISYGSGQLVSEGKQFGDIASVLYESKDTITMSKFLASAATLDPELIDFEATNSTGILTLKTPGAIYGTNLIDYKTNPRIVATSDSFNKANFAFFSRLFINMQNIYSYVQNLLFIFIGMFFIAKVGFDKGMRALDKSKEDDTQWLSKFYVPVLTVGFFFAPIPEDAGMNATVVQKMIRFMAIESTSIADRASTVLTDTYLKKLYDTVGAQTTTGEKQIKETLYNAQLLSKTYKKALDDFCAVRFPHSSTFQANNYWAERYEMINANNVTDKDISYAACREIERNYMIANNQIRDYTIYSRGIEQAYNNGKLQTKLSEINTKVSAEQKELGFIYATMLPGMSFVVENIGLIENNDMIKQQQDVQKADLEQLAINRGNSFKTEQEAWFGKSPKAELGEVTGNIVGQTTYFMLPGASGMFNFFDKQKDKIFDAIKTKGIGTILKNVISAGADIGTLYLTAFTYDNILKYLPIIVSCVAACIAVISWFLQLLKYFYISPFVVAYALGTRTPQKIVDFLVTGLTVFFRPVLLVIFIGLALVVHVLIVDIFQTLALKQIGFMENIQQEFWLSFIVSIIETLFKIITPIGAIYIMWKLILTGPTWTFQLLGVEQRMQEITEGLASKLERFSNPI